MNAYVEPLGKAISCVTNAVINVRGGYFPALEPHSLTIGDKLDDGGE